MMLSRNRFGSQNCCGSLGLLFDRMGHPQESRFKMEGTRAERCWCVIGKANERERVESRLCFSWH